MRQVTFLLIGTFVLAMSIVTAWQAQAATPATSGVSVSPHNLNTFEGHVVPNSEVCRSCHAPHEPANGDEALFNHEVDEGVSYSLYNVAHPGTKWTTKYVGLDSSSKLCLSCHDGAIAVDNYGGNTSGNKFITGDHLVGSGGDLGTVHPVGLTYPMKADGVTPESGFKDPNAAEFSADGVGTAKGVQLVKLPDGSKGVGCRSCHHSHNSSLGNFLRTSNEYSFLCLKCHGK